jgi:hypothetical protein
MDILCTAYKVDVNRRGSDVVAETVAALAAASMIFRGVDNAYSARLQAARTHEGGKLTSYWHEFWCSFFLSQTDTEVNTMMVSEELCAFSTTPTLGLR